MRRWPPTLNNGEIDAIYNLDPDLRCQLDGDDNITPIEAQDGSFTQLTINTGSGDIGNGHPALEDVRVRQAIAHAIDKDALVERVLDGLGVAGRVHERRRRAGVGRSTSRPTR